MTGRDYAQQTGVSETTLSHKIKAARVVTDVGNADGLSDRWCQLDELHAASRWLWPALVARLIAEDWTVRDTRQAAQKFKDIAEPLDWADRETLAGAIVRETMKLGDYRQFFTIAEKTASNIAKLGEDAERLTGELYKRLAGKRPSTVSAVQAICLAVEAEQRALIEQRQQADFARTKREEEIVARTLRLRKNISLQEYKALEPDERVHLISLTGDDGDAGFFNKQENNSIEWAQWSWNPVTGCEHNCPYCYARDIANDPKMAKVYPHRFEPAFRPLTVLAPRSMKVPKEAETDTRYRNVFTCSMADLFGRWVPKEWIETVLREIRAAPQWNFLCLTKFPKRMAEFDIPSNAWMGTTVDLQARVPNAEAAFEKIKAGVRWLSVEPMLEPLKFKHLERFNWMVIGGASRSSETPEWKPPMGWVIDLVGQAREAGVKVYFKTNLLGKRLLELPFDAPIPGETEGPPAEFRYLTKAPT
jgi:protein gp37